MRKDPLIGKKIIFGVTGCIAAYKSALLVRDLIKRGAEVKVVMTPAATQFITPLTLSSLSKNNVVVYIFPESTAGNTDMTTWHIDMARWADVILIAPSTINTIAKIAQCFNHISFCLQITCYYCSCSGCRYVPKSSHPG